jgi:hypothetical protein
MPSLPFWQSPAEHVTRQQRMAQLLREMSGLTVLYDPWKEQLQSIEFRMALLCALHLDEDTQRIGRVIEGLNTIRDYLDQQGPMHSRGLN